MTDEFIDIRGAREHNLKNINLKLPKDKLITFTGVSGSGKSSLAFDTLYAEGQRALYRIALGLCPPVPRSTGKNPMSISSAGYPHPSRLTKNQPATIHVQPSPPSLRFTTTSA